MTYIALQDHAAHPRYHPLLQKITVLIQGGAAYRKVPPSMSKPLFSGTNLTGFGIRGEIPILKVELVFYLKSLAHYTKWLAVTNIL